MDTPDRRDLLAACLWTTALVLTVRVSDGVFVRTLLGAPAALLIPGHALLRAIGIRVSTLSEHILYAVGASLAIGIAGGFALNVAHLMNSGRMGSLVLDSDRLGVAGGPEASHARISVRASLRLRPRACPGDRPGCLAGRRSLRFGGPRRKCPTTVRIHRILAGAFGRRRPFRSRHPQRREADTALRR